MNEKEKIYSILKEAIETCKDCFIDNDLLEFIYVSKEQGVEVKIDVTKKE